MKSLHRNGVVFAILWAMLILPLSALAQAPNVTSVAPTTATAGTQAIFTGTGFGSTQGSGNVWLGSTYGTVVSWSDTQVVATVASGSKSGTAQILQNGVWSSAVSFTVITPVVTSVTPAGGIAGTQVTFTGSGFGATQGSGNVWLGSTYGTVVSWSDTQVVATVASGSKSGTAQILQGGVWSDVISFNVVTPVVTSVTPSSGIAGTQVTITGSGFGSTQGSVSFNGTVATQINSWTDTSIIASVPAGATSGDIIVTVNSQASNNLPFTVLINPILSGRFSQTVTAVSLTSPLVLDWEHWGTSNDQPLVRMAGIAPFISDFSIIGSNTPVLFSDGEIEYLWTDGDSLPAAERTTTGVSISGAGNGFHLTVPADTVPKTIVLYVGANNGQGQLTASLSDNSSAPYVDSSLNAGAGNDLSGTYAIDFRAGQPGQTLNIDYVLLVDNGAGTALVGKVTLESAALFPHLPSVSLIAPADGQIFAYPSDLSASVTASQIDTSLAKVDLLSGSQNLLQLITAPYSFTLSGLAPGDHVLTAKATDSAGLVSSSDPVVVAEIQGGGSLTATVATPVDVDLSAGTTDWVHWGNLDSAANLDRKAGITPQISDLTTLANGAAYVSDETGHGSVNYSWSGGTPTASQLGTATQVFMRGYKNGFTLTIPADTTLRTARLYLGYGDGSSRLRASLSDGSAAPWVNVFSTTDFYDEKVVTLQFQAASAGQSLIISDQVIEDGGFAYVDLESATVADQNAPAISAVSPASGGPGTTLTISGSNFGDSPAGSVTLSGSALTVNSWSNSAITATLTGGYASGPIVVSQGLANSNGLPFTYLGPMITSLIPNAGPPGTLVTISGQNLSTQNPTTVTFGGLPANVISQGPGAIQVTVPSTIGFGPAQVVVQTSSGTTNALQFDVVHAPVITSLTPNFGVTGQLVKIYGSNFGQLQGDSTISFFGYIATPLSWSESVIETRVPPGFVGGIVNVTVGGQTSNGLPFEVPFRCLIDCNAKPSAVSISPQKVSLVVGDEVNLNVVDNLGETVPFPAFTMSDPTLGTLASGDKNSTFTALAPGTETVTVTVGTLTASTTITIYAGPTLPDGTIKWQIPSSIVGGSAANFVQAQPASNSATATFVEDLSDPRNNVIIRALDASGMQLWAWPTQTSFHTLFFNPVVPTPTGGFVYTDGGSINSIDANGHPLWTYPYPQFRFEPLTVGYDGTVYALVNLTDVNASHLVALDAVQGTEKFRIPLPQGHFSITGTSNDSSGTIPGIPSRPIVLADGSIHVAVWNSNFTEVASPNTHVANPPNNSHDPNRTGNTIWCPADVLECWAPVDSFGNPVKNQSDTVDEQEIILVSIQPDGSYQQHLVSQNQSECVQFGSHFVYVQDDAFALPGTHVIGEITTANGVAFNGHSYEQNIFNWFTGTCGVMPPGPNGFDLMVVPNGSGGVLVASETNDPGNPVWIKNVAQPAISGDGAEISISSLNTLNRLVIGENGTAFAAGSWNFFETPRLVSFNLAGGTNWTYDSPFGTPDAPGYVDIVAAGPNGSLYATEGDFFNQEPKVAFTLDGTGVRTDNPTSSQQLTFLAGSGFLNSTWLGANVPPLVASLGGIEAPIGFLPPFQFAIPADPPGVTAYAGALIDTIESSYAATSPSGKEGRNWFFILVWQNDFYFIPANPTVISSLRTAIPDKAVAIKNQALAALREAYKDYPVTIVEGTLGTGDVRVTIPNLPPSTAAGLCGNTDFTKDRDHMTTVPYQTHMEFAQEAISLKITNAQQEASALKNANLIRAIANGIGNVSAHEIAHQFLVSCCDMDVDVPDPLAGTVLDPVAAANSLGTYNRHNCEPSPDPTNPTSDPSPWTGLMKDRKTSIHWQDLTAHGLSNCLKPGWHAGTPGNNCNKNPNAP